MRAILVLAATMLAHASAGATTFCTSEPADKWMSEAAFRARVAAMGLRIEAFKRTAGNCYEIYGRDVEGRRVEIYFEPVNADPVKRTVR